MLFSDNRLSTKGTDSFLPRRRTWFRLLAGRVYYGLRRHLYWKCSGKKFARKDSGRLAPGLILFTHQSMLFRHLQGLPDELQYNKINNLKIALESLNGVWIKPGEIFSYWKLIGNPTAIRGYQKGLVLYNGKMTAGTGGGLCQLSNLIYWMTLHTPLTVIERWRHSYDVFPDSSRTLPFGSGATCSYNQLDLQIENRTPYSFYLHLYLSDTQLYGEWRVSEDPKVRFSLREEAHRVTREIWGGYVRHNQIWRKTYTIDGVLLSDEMITENHALMMYQPQLEFSKV